MRLKEYANQKDIRIIGDIPIFVSMDSADVWASQHLFQLDSNGYPLKVAGVPPDYFSATGQLWGNPLYAWDAHKEEALPGGSPESGTSWMSLISSGLIISAGLRPTGRWNTGEDRHQRAMGAGSWL